MEPRRCRIPVAGSPAVGRTSGRSREAGANARRYHRRYHPAVMPSPRCQYTAPVRDGVQASGVTSIRQVGVTSSAWPSCCRHGAWASGGASNSAGERTSPAARKFQRPPHGWRRIVSVGATRKTPRRTSRAERSRRYDVRLGVSGRRRNNVGGRVASSTPKVERRSGTVEVFGDDGI